MKNMPASKVRSDADRSALVAETGSFDNDDATVDSAHLDRRIAECNHNTQWTSDGMVTGAFGHLGIWAFGHSSRFQLQSQHSSATGRNNQGAIGRTVFD
jgi:hypothetical protein